MNLTTDQTIIYGLATILVLLVLWIVYLERRLEKIFRGKKAGDLEDVLVDMGRSIDELSTKHSHLKNFTDNIDSRLKTAIQKVYTLRFNPFRDHGGNQSFATALLDEMSDGVVISSLYSRDKVSVYAKPIVNGQSDFELSDEERESIAKAQASQKG
ncbi:MAG: hypothetical protein UV64_C0025G0009 [Parcubacteria group bacterium GW2011_GWC1_43_11b]|uniref:DUF4446 domain-containing protein n=2 Tax=Candidatus Vogeliibacteriota TaxID=1817922 RepID=A0A1G2QDG2_9BACT|nr:MAG: hypothetical protein UV50_C0017G0009 [Parcubacteria group bacterium GW2011_GWB1_42_9]KKS88301.1 MAG: hypothetical protein UV64_C0025G0009 [Parcubacteria group bacterium GW2011_GWC1_43_11b]KKT09208.1 MAG: hypothetical protein UV88_C0014G0006 [Parcubacteria group bacterium GW2011_GWA1_43_21]OHA58083.1 MAG: hypothetical protein A2607_02335 [Candidatus Vogelbacteria bacterium RIFOXYD1_FULL_42_15]OHA58129.1 MAG: hypothetical protein A2370_02240 [Candidatus Vogelbacteria bacterium RIFOXYB1_FU